MNVDKSTDCSRMDVVYSVTGEGCQDSVVQGPKPLHSPRPEEVGGLDRIHYIGMTSTLMHHHGKSHLQSVKTEKDEQF